MGYSLEPKGRECCIFLHQEKKVLTLKIKIYLNRICLIKINFRQLSILYSIVESDELNYLNCNMNVKCVQF